MPDQLTLKLSHPLRRLHGVTENPQPGEVSR